MSAQYGSDQGGYGQYVYGYDSYGGGYGGGGGPQDNIVRSRGAREYLLMFRERWWVWLLCFLVLFGAALLHSFLATPIYQAVATIELLRDDPKALGQDAELDLDMTQVFSMEDFQTQINKLKSGGIVQKVSNRLKGEELTRFMAPYEDMKRLKGPMTASEALVIYRAIVPRRQSLTVDIVYAHPDRELAARIANLYATEFIEDNKRLLIDSSMEGVDKLKIKTDAQRDKVAKLDQELSDYQRKYGNFSFDEKRDIDMQELATLSDLALKAEMALNESQSQWELVLQYQDKKRPLWELAFIGDMPQIQRHLMDLSARKVEMAALRKRYRHKHPTMIEATRGLEQNEQELVNAVTTAVEKIQNTYINAKKNHERTVARRDQKQEDMLSLADAHNEYKDIVRRKVAEESILEGFQKRLTIQSASTGMKKANVRIVDKAMAPLHPSSPNIVLNVILGFIGGNGLGIGLVLLLGFLDDRVKSTGDVETHLSVQILGVVPKVSRLDSFEKARISLENSNRRTAEAFRSIYSAVKLSDTGRNAQVILTTSTVPSEGKSFVTTNLAATFASHGERTLLLEGDLRMPAVAYTLGLEQHIGANGGLVDYFQGEAGWDGLIARNITENLDVLATITRADRPSEIINSGHFADMMEMLREQYDRIFIDSPPLGVVSDALSMLPLADGCLYVIRHNEVKLRQARNVIRQLQESQVPMLGAVMNRVNRMGSSYYAGYDGKNYDSYYGGKRKVKSRA